MTIDLPEMFRHGGRRILPRRSVTMKTEPVRVGHSLGNADVVEMELVHEGELLREIHFKCPCGQAIVLECDYANDVHSK